MNRPVAALYVRPDTVYRTIAGVDCWDAVRDARGWPGGRAAIAHPPRRSWGHQREHAHPAYGEHELSILAVRQVQTWGGVLEHPASSALWGHCGLPGPGATWCDYLGGWSLSVSLRWWGHWAERRMWLYIVGIQPADIPTLPVAGLGAPTWIGPRLNPDRTPEAFARWLVELAGRTTRPVTGRRDP